MSEDRIERLLFRLQDTEQCVDAIDEAIETITSLHARAEKLVGGLRGIKEFSLLKSRHCLECAGNAFHAQKLIAEYKAGK